MLIQNVSWYMICIMWHINAKNIIQQQGVIQKDLAPVLGVKTVGAVGHYLRGKRQPTPQQLKNLADHLGVKIDDFFQTENSQALAGRLTARRSTLQARYAWSTPDHANDAALTYNVIQAGIFQDMLELATQIGIDSFIDAVQKHPQDHFSAPRLKIADNIHEGYRQSVSHAA